MFIYLLFSIILGFLGILSSLKNINHRIKLLFLFIFIFLSIIFSIRDGLGIDYYSYKAIYNNIDARNDIEIGYMFINKFFNFLGASFEEFLFFFTMVNMLLIYKSIKIYSINFFYSFYIFYSYYVLSYVFSGIRQSIAMSIGLLSFNFIIKDKPFKYFFTILIASSFHIVSLIYVPFYFISKMKIKKNYIFFLVILTFIIGKTNIIKTVLIQLSNLPFFENIRYILYSEHFGRKLGFGLGDLEKLGVVILIFIFYNEIKSSKSMFILSQSYILSVVIYFLFNNISELARRVSTPYRISEIILIPFLINNIKSKYLRLIVFLIFLILISFRLISIINNGYDSLVPFKIII